MELVHSGKIREVYADGDDILLVASDKVSVYDVVLPTLIPDKGKILTQLSLWWFDRISGVRIPEGLAEGSRLPEPVFTPTTKAVVGHDEFIDYRDLEAAVGADVASDLRRLTLEVYRRGAEIAAGRGVIIADTKLEFGQAPDGTIVLADEVLTPDSSRFWSAAEWRPGGPQRYMDKQFVRDWSATITGWDRKPPGPEVPQDIVDATRARYIEVYERITGTRWQD